MSYKEIWQTICMANCKYFNILNMPKKRLKKDKEVKNASSVEVIAPRTIELKFSNLCNLKCVMCSPNWSSQLLAEVNLNPSLQKLYPADTLDQKKYNWAKEDDFVNWCNKHLPESIHIKFTGGEPFIIPWIQTVIDKKPDEQKKKSVLHFTTNQTIVN